jgi:hypothetical protein
MIILSESQRNSIQSYILVGKIDDFLEEAERILEQEGDDVKDALSFAEKEKNRLSECEDWENYDEMAIVVMILKNSSLNPNA